MKRLLGAAVALVLTAQAPPPARLAELGWLSGSWLSVRAGERVEETWSSPSGGMMLGFSRSVRNDVGREFEFLRIAAGPDGTLAYFAQPGGGAPVAFRLVRHERTSATFENPAHDYPQRIRYERFGNSLVATISSIDGSGERSWNYNRQR